VLSGRFDQPGMPAGIGCGLLPQFSTARLCSVHPVCRFRNQRTAFLFSRHEEAPRIPERPPAYAAGCGAQKLMLTAIGWALQERFPPPKTLPPAIVSLVSRMNEESDAT
jgi:hypothetical protein